MSEGLLVVVAAVGAPACAGALAVPDAVQVYPAGRADGGQGAVRAVPRPVAHALRRSGAGGEREQKLAI